MKTKTKPLLSKALSALKAFAVAAWTVPAVKSKLLTWLIRIGVPSGIATVALAVADALNGTI